MTGMLNIQGDEDAVNQYNDMKTKHTSAYIIFALNKKGDAISVETNVTKTDAGEDYLDAFCDKIKESGAPRFAVVDWNHKLCFVAWSPDTAKGKDKMTYATIREGFVQQLEGIGLKLQATDDGELNKKAIEEKTVSKV